MTNPSATGPSSWRVRLAFVVVAFLLAAGIAVSAVGRDKTWHWIESWWRLDIGAPAATSPYPVDLETPDVRLAVAGDVGTGESAEYDTASAMDALELTGEFDALLLLGDNVYPAGDPAALRTNVLDPFAQVLDNGTELVAALGNHDIQTNNGDGQIDSLGLPGRWYAERFGPVRVVVVDSTQASNAEQLTWLEDELSTPTDAAWTVVIQHHPPFSAGYHGSHEPSQQHLVPLYETYDVDLVLSGHDHDYQRIAPQNGVTYVVSGGAAKLRRTASAGFTVVAASTYHFVEIAAFDSRLDLRAVDQDGRVFDSFSLTTPASAIPHSSRGSTSTVTPRPTWPRNHPDR